MGEHQVLLNHPQIDFKKTVYPQIIWTEALLPYYALYVSKSLIKASVRHFAALEII